MIDSDKSDEMDLIGYTFKTKDGINWVCPGTAYTLHKGPGRPAEWKATYVASSEDDTTHVSVRLTARAVTPEAVVSVITSKVNAELERLWTYAWPPEEEEE
jgi:hypothetical protein